MIFSSGNWLMSIVITFMMLTGCSLGNDITFDVALKQRNVDLLPHLVDLVSDPSSLNYGQYLSIDNINNIVSPMACDKLLVSNWITKNNMFILNDYGDGLKVKGSIVNVSKAFDITILPLRAGFKIQGDYIIPKELNYIVEFIEGLSNTKYPRIKVYSRVKDKKVDSGYVGRESLLSLYNINSSLTIKNASVGVVEYTGSAGFSQDGLLESESMNSEKNNSVTDKHTIGSIDGEDIESQLDVIAASITGHGADLWYWKTDSWLYSFALDFMNSKQTPDVISMSWGWAEDSQCSITTCTNQTSEQYVNRVNAEYMKLALRGITITVSSGDAGAPGRTSESCDSSRPMNPVFPGSSPWVTSVGATVVMDDGRIGLSKFNSPLCLNNTCATGHTEYSINYDLTGWTAGGGFGMYGTEKTPKWQSKQVQTYFKNNPNLNKSSFNVNGRGYPDVSAVGHNCPIYSDSTPDSLSPVDGTSCSSPYFAGIVSLLNDHQLGRKKPKLGFANPVFYRMAEDGVFNDITVGYNWCTEYQCCDNNNKTSNFGFLAGKGWDPVSGLGTPNVGKMMDWLDKNL
jgi:subtilase family serine protease